MKIINNALSKNLLFNWKDPGKPRVLLLKSTRISAVNIGWKTIHLALRIKPGAKLLGCSDKSKTSLRNEVSEVKLIMIDEISMISSELWTSEFT